MAIDQQAHDIWVRKIYGLQERGLGASGRYNLLADCYRAAARKFGEAPSTVQRGSPTSSATEGDSGMLHPS
ncbi:DUF7178 family protein [Streptomyces sp. 1222.5]|uniref:DUF7178 family protein n=1 Tax=Streptomyces sp. 1222.5 TaxID=1881026 RepID=UPI003EBDB108